MQDLTLVGLSEDGARLVLAGPSGEEYAVPVDSALRAALRGRPEPTTPRSSARPPARTGHLEKKMESALRPRDIQARIRAGESPEEVATAAQTTVEAIMGFATPVLAERAHVARTAQKASVRRRADTGAAPRTLGEAAEAFFSRHRLHDEDVAWDSWRRSDGRWSLVATYAVDGATRTAEFTHDVPGRFVVADNDDARQLTGEVAAGGTAPVLSEAPRRRLAPVPQGDDLPLGDDALEMVRDHEQPAAVEEPHEEPVALEEPVEEPVEPAVEPAAQESTQESADPTAVRGDADWIAEQPPLFGDHEPEASPAPADEEPEPVAETGEDDAEKPRSSRKKGRASVPSWDEIMFGGSDRG